MRSACASGCATVGWSTCGSRHEIAVLILVRHGRTAANASGLLQGRLDLPLDGVGRAQVAAMAERVGRPARVVSSPLLRARQTAEAFGVPYEVDDRWEELYYGDYEGVSMTYVSP